MPKILNDPKRRMLSEVANLLAAGGYGAVTIRAVASGCGVGVGTVYNYFPSKEALLAEYLLEDWRNCMAAIQQTSLCYQTPEPIAHCIYDQLRAYVQCHSAVFLDQAAWGAFVGSFGHYHGLLRSQLAAYLLCFCSSPFAAEFVTEALLTWTMNQQEFDQIWQMLQPLLYPTKHSS